MWLDFYLLDMGTYDPMYFTKKDMLKKYILLGIVEDNKNVKPVAWSKNVVS